MIAATYPHSTEDLRFLRRESSRPFSHELRQSFDRRASHSGYSGHAVLSSE